MSWMEIGLFQLENLSLTPARFVFLDLRAVASAPVPASPHIDKLLSKATAVSSDLVEDHLRQVNPDGGTPVLLVCEDGKTSQALAERLERAGFANVYVVAGGVRGLLSEV